MYDWMQYFLYLISGYPENLLIEACKNKNIYLVKKLLTIPGININYQNLKDNTALHVALIEESYDITKALLEHPNIDPNLRNERGETPLKVAFSNNNYGPNSKLSKRYFKLVELLLEHPAIQVNIANQRGISPLYVACYQQKLDYALALLRHEDINVTCVDLKGNTPLHVCIYHDPHYGQGLGVEVSGPLRENLPKVQIAHALLKKEPKLINAKNKKGETILHICAKNGDWELARVLLRDYKPDVNVQDLKGKTALHYACKHKMKKIIKSLLAHPQINNSCEDFQQKTPIDYVKDSSNLLSFFNERAQKNNNHENLSGADVNNLNAFHLL